MGKAESEESSSSSSSSSSDDDSPTPSRVSTKSKSNQSPIPTTSKPKADATSSPVGAGPRTPKASKGYVKRAMEAAPTTPRNMDGTLWKNPLNRWTNKPDESKITESGTKIAVKISTRTDCWRKSYPNPHVIQDNAPFYWHKVSGDFEVMVKVAGDFGTDGDKAGIMVRLDDQTWVHTGLEQGEDGATVNHFTCVTRDYTDRSVSPLPSAKIERAGGVWICLKRLGNAFETFYSYDALNWDQSRQGLFTERPVLQVGLCGACPKGNEYAVVFDQYRVKTI